MTESKPIDAEMMPEQTQAIAIRQEHQIAPTQANDGSKPPITAAQAKVDAVAALTMSAYEKAATLVLTPEESAKLQADFPDEAFQPGAGGNAHLIYIEHAHLRNRFNSVFGMGAWAIVPRNRWAEPFKTAKGTEGSRVYVEAMLVVRGCFVGEAVGAMEYYPKNDSQNYGDAVEGAKTAAFRRCAKEFGVGLQAWKKDFCDAWWARKRGGRDFSKKPSPPTAPDSFTAPAPAPAPVHVPAPAPTPGPKLKPPTFATRLWMIEQITKAGLHDIAVEYFQKVDNPSVLMPKEGLSEVPLWSVPNCHSEMSMLITKIKEFANGERAGHAFPPHLDAEDAHPPKPAAASLPKPVTDINHPALGSPGVHNPEWWREFIVPVPRKGQKRSDYVGNEDTLGSLFDQRHGNDEESQAARQRLWGFVNHYEPKGWVKKDGTKMPPSDVDIKFREALDALAQWFETNHRGEKL